MVEAKIIPRQQVEEECPPWISGCVTDGGDAKSMETTGNAGTSTNALIPPDTTETSSEEVASLVTTTSNAVMTTPYIATVITSFENGAVPPVTAAPTQPATLSSDNSSGSDNRLAPGAVAGIAIAMLIVGAALAFLAAMFMFKRRQRHQENNMGTAKGYTSFADSVPELVTMQQAKSVNIGGQRSPYVQIAQSSVPPMIAAPVLVHHKRNQSGPDLGFLPAPAQDNAIQMRISALFNGLHQHIETYYRDVHASITPSMEAGLERFGRKGVNMTELLQDCSSPTSALKHALVAYILNITSPTTNELFPATLRILNQSLSGDANLTLASTLHRRLSVYLYTSPSPSSSYNHSSTTLPNNLTSHSANTHSSMREAAEHFSLTFFPWANPSSSDQDKDEDLARLIADALDFSIWLYGQPYEYEFDWEIGRRGLLVSPGLMRNLEGGKRDWIVEGVVVGV